MKCNVCSENTPAKYKCPKCRIPYCSVRCWKEHKSADCTYIAEQFGDSEKKPCNLYSFPTEDTVALEKLKLLDNSKVLKNLLCNQHLRNMISAIDKASSPAAAMQESMLVPIFCEFADECLKIVEPQEQST